MKTTKFALGGGFGFLLSLFILQASSLQAQDSRSTGVMRGRVVSAEGNGPVEGVGIVVSLAAGHGETNAGERPSVVELQTDSDGRFSTEIYAGRFDVFAEAFGFENYTEFDVEVRVGQSTELFVRLETDPFRLDEIVVMPSTFGMLRDHVVSGQMLSRQELDARPHMGNDIFRAVGQVPGVTAFDHTAAPYVRGARAEEVLTLLDGLELYEPYHLKQWDGSLSIVDVENVQNVNLTTGGFTSEFGDASTGVLSMRTATPTVEGTRTTLGLDFMSSILKNEGTFDDGKGSWVFSARRGFLDLVFAITGITSGEDLNPSYYDIYSKTEYEIRPGQRISAHFLHAGDDNHGIENDSTVYRHRYGSSYAWMNWFADLSRETSVRTMFSLGRVWRDRNGSDYYEPGSRPHLEVRDQATYDFFGVRQDWTHRLSRNLLLKGGIEAKWGQADYEYFRYEERYEPNFTDQARSDYSLEFDNLRVANQPDGNELGGYLAGRVQPLDLLTVEAGLRYERQSHTDEQQFGPRINAAYQLAPQTNLRGAWGIYHQSHGLHQMWAGDGDENFYTAQEAEHRVLGLEHSLDNGISFRVDAYQRLLTDPLPEFRNLEDHTEGLKEEGPEDRFFIHAEAGRAHGIEFFAKNRPDSRFSWSASYALAVAEEKIEGEWVPRPFDQRHSIKFHFVARPTSQLSLSAAWTYHSPWPFTDQTYSSRQTVNGYTHWTRDFGQINQGRMIPYRRLDVRVSRVFRLKKGHLIAYLDVFNATNRENAQSANFFLNYRPSGPFADHEYHAQMEVMPTLGLRWIF